MINPPINKLRAQAECIYSAQQVQRAIQKMAQSINQVLADKDPIVISIMNGGLVLTGQLLPLLDFPLQLDYLHATRYQGGTIGQDLHWINTPQTDLKGRVVLLLDDILEQGITLAGIIDYCKAQGASEIYCGVLLTKQLPNRQCPIDIDFPGLNVGDRYVFGFGMDLYHYWRNADGIYAIKEDE